MILINRRNLLAGAAAAGASLILAGCTTTQSGPGFEADASVPQQPGAKPADAPSPDLIAKANEANGPIDYEAMYSGFQDGGFQVPTVKLSQIKKGFMRKLVDYQTNEPVGTIVIDPAARYLYHILPNGQAMRYGIGPGREGFAWSGVAEIHSKQEWPDWYPPKEMIAREPQFANHWRNCKAASACTAVPAIRSAPAPCISGRATRIRCSASTARSNRRRSARTPLPAASA